MKKQLPEIKFDNKDNPKSYFDIVKIEDLLKRSLDHDIGKNHLVKFYIIFFVYEGQGYHTIRANASKFSPSLCRELPELSPRFPRGIPEVSPRYPRGIGTQRDAAGQAGVKYFLSFLLSEIR